MRKKIKFFYSNFNTNLKYKKVVKKSFLNKKKKRLVLPSLSFKNVLTYQNYDFPKDSVVNATRNISIKPFSYKLYKLNSYLYKYIVLIKRSIEHLYSTSFFKSFAYKASFNFFSFYAKDNAKVYEGNILLKNYSINVPYLNILLLKYVPYWISLIRHKFFLNKIIKNRLLGSYPISKKYLFTNDIFFPSDTNIFIFLKFGYNLKSLKTKTDIIISNNLALVLELKKKLNLLTEKKGQILLKNNFKTRIIDLILTYKKWYLATKSFLKKPKYKKRFKKLLYLKLIHNFRTRLKLLFLKKKIIRIQPRKLKRFNKKIKNFFIKVKLADLTFKSIFASENNNSIGSIKNRISLFKTLGIFRETNKPTLSFKLNTKFNLNKIFFKKFLLFFYYFTNPTLSKSFFFYNTQKNLLKNIWYLTNLGTLNLKTSNLIPNNCFNFKFTKTLVLLKSSLFLKENIIPWTYNTILRFIEFSSGKKSFIQIYPFMNQAIDLDFIILYKRWIPRFASFERRLGHRFFLEEALHILHMSFNLHDIKLVGTWFKAIITRISFWKTRSIFRFIKYIFNNYFSFLFHKIGIKGFKVKLKGKISVAGNSRKRTILYRVGQTSHASCNLKVIHNFSTIITFTGVMGFQVWIFY